MMESQNKVYYGVKHNNVIRGTEWHIASKYSFEYLPDFSYTGDFDIVIGE